jgi:hypothetical protein
VNNTTAASFKAKVPRLVRYIVRVEARRIDHSSYPGHHTGTNNPMNFRVPASEQSSLSLPASAAIATTETRS